MFDRLAGNLQDIFKRLRGQAYLSESNIAEAMREIRTALLDADVNYQIAKDFVETAGKKCLGHEVLRSITPGQQVIKIVHDQLVELMGSSEASLTLDSTPSAIMMVGLHGSGKTTSSAKLARHLKNKNKTVMLVAADVYRPAAIDQLETLGASLGIPVHSARSETDVARIATAAMADAKSKGIDVVIVDTAGRHQVDEAMVKELILVSKAIRPKEILLVADSALGQEAVSVSEHFHKALGLTGVILTKLDGDARGGAALSIRKTTECPIKFVGIGEKLEDFEVFHPDRMASRILGMGDIVSLVERAAEEIDAAEAERLEQKIRANQFDLDDFLTQLRQMRRMGGLEKILKLLPGGGDALAGAQVDTRQFSVMEAIILSMTRAERAEPEIINFARRKRVAKGSGATMDQVNNLLHQFSVMKKIISRSSLVKNIMSGAGLPSHDSLRRGTNRIKPKNRKKKNKR